MSLIHSSKYSLTVQKTSGHVGIGKVDPDYKLDVDGGSRFLTEGNTAGVISKDSMSSQWVIVEMVVRRKNSSLV